MSVLAVTSKILLATKTEDAMFFEEYPKITYTFG
jgi:hypothetical protein